MPPHRYGADPEAARHAPTSASHRQNLPIAALRPPAPLGPSQPTQLRRPRPVAATRPPGRRAVPPAGRLVGWSVGRSLCARDPYGAGPPRTELVHKVDRAVAEPGVARVRARARAVPAHAPRGPGPAPITLRPGAGGELTVGLASVSGPHPQRSPRRRHQHRRDQAATEPTTQPDNPSAWGFSPRTPADNPTRVRLCGPPSGVPFGGRGHHVGTCGTPHDVSHRSRHLVPGSCSCPKSPPTVRRPPPPPSGAGWCHPAPAGGGWRRLVVAGAGWWCGCRSARDWHHSGVAAATRCLIGAQSRAGRRPTETTGEPENQSQLR